VVAPPTAKFNPMPIDPEIMQHVVPRWLMTGDVVWTPGRLEVDSADTIVGERETENGRRKLMLGTDGRTDGRWSVGSHL
jgi:hypothetical protein